jgi:hypothetical protein
MLPSSISLRARSARRHGASVPQTSQHFVVPAGCSAGPTLIANHIHLVDFAGCIPLSTLVPTAEMGYRSYLWESMLEHGPGYRLHARQT